MMFQRVLLESTDEQAWDEKIGAVLTQPQVLALQREVEQVQAEPSLVDYLMEVVRRTRTEPRLRMGVSPRGAIALFRASRALALLDGRSYLVPSDVHRLVVPCLAHRLLPIGATAATHEAHEESAAILADILEDVAVPV